MGRSPHAFVDPGVDIRRRMEDGFAQRDDAFESSLPCLSSRPSRLRVRHSASRTGFGSREDAESTERGALTKMPISAAIH